ncbi:MAG: NAD(P)-binding domain-containing protein [Candidatus Omnitrophica bacterium]|nr:NAD(P)-binding domain-containing protein [Candidatus Omnitrophota bacterium]
MDENDKGMIRVEVRKVIPAKRWKILRLITRVQDFPKFMPSVKSCTVLERKHHEALTAWNVEVENFPLSWKEREVFDVKNFIVRFQLVEGDLECFEGEWCLKNHATGGTEVIINTRARIGMPFLDEMVGHVIADKIKKNFELILHAIDNTLRMRRYKLIGDRKSSDLKGFSVVGHPYNVQHLIRYLKFFKPDLKMPSQEFLSKIFEITPSYKSYEVKNFRSKTGQEVNGFFIMCPIVPDMLLLSPERVVEKVVEACRISESLGAGIVTLGGFTSIAGERYSKVLLSAVHIPVTTGNTFTVALVLDGVYKAAQLMEVDMSHAKVTVIGGTGDIGNACARILSEKVSEITITSRSEKNLMEAERVLAYYGKAKIKTSRDNNEAVRNADIVIAAASSTGAIVDLHNFKPGAIVCDVGYPKNISYTQCDRKDILIFSGGISALPSEFNLGFDLGLPSTRVLYGCFAEAILLDLEERYENFSWGKGFITNDKVGIISEIGRKHGFEVAPFFWGNRLLGDSDIAAIKEAKKEVMFKNGQ